MTRDSDEATDVVQNAIISAYEGLEGFKPEYRFFSWLYRIALNSALQATTRRREVVALSNDIEDPSPLPEQAIERQELEERIDEALMELSLDARVVLVLQHFAELTYREIGWVLEIPEKTVRSRLLEATSANLPKNLSDRRPEWVSSVTCRDLGWRLVRTPGSTTSSFPLSS